MVTHNELNAVFCYCIFSPEGSIDVLYRQTEKNLRFINLLAGSWLVSVFNNVTPKFIKPIMGLGVCERWLSVRCISP